MAILFFTDIKFEYMAKHLIESLDIQKIDTEFLYYTLGFDSTIEYPNLIKKRWEIDINKPKFEYYKPTLLIDALKNYDKIIYFDSDIIIGRRFNLTNFEHEFNYPLASIGNWDFPYMFYDNKDGNRETVNESKLMEYLHVKERTMNYVYACFMNVNRNCIEFLKEWEHLCNDSYLLKNFEKYYPLHDETSFNVLLWKKNVDKNYGRIFLNTLYSDPLEFIEENDNFQGRVFSVPEQHVDNSSNIIFYHGLKDKQELKNVLLYLKNIKEQ